MTPNRNNHTLNIGGRLLSLNEPLVMGIINLTPDSFHSASRTSAEDAAVRAERMLAEGASIIDLGGVSTRPGATTVSADDEWARLAKPLESIRRRLPEAIISIDTYRAEVARRCVEELGANIINDISGGTFDPEMFPTVADLKVPYVLMHTRGTSETMHERSSYDDVTAEVLSELAFRDAELRRLGVCDVIVDPGFGFAKDTPQNYSLLNNLEMLHALQRPLLVGVSRKSMVFRALGRTPAEALNGTTVLNTVALIKGASILRVHDVREAAEAIRLTQLIKNQGPQIS